MAKSCPVDWSKESLPLELLELRKQMAVLPARQREKMLPLCDRVCHFIRLQTRLIKIAQDAVDQLQLDVKYLNFDLQATRQERDAFRRELEEQSEEF
ncbi:MAG: transcriptional regulator [Planctomycetes bacterium]|nr:transcriptional regulator [Planctomycetota bacterium]